MRIPHVDFDFSTASSFWKHVDKSGSCWLWTGCKTDLGYGLFAGGGYKANGQRRLVNVHRYSYALANGLFEPEDRVLHSCDNPPCVNPDHLRLGTQRDNIQEMHDKGRGFLAQGETHWGHVLTDALVLKLRHHARRGKSASALAREFGHNRRTIRDAIVGVTWKHLEDQPREATP